MIERGVPFDVVVTDIEMPEMDGFELAKALRQHRSLDHVPILAFTSTVNETFRERAAISGIASMILKTDREALIQALAAQLTSVREAA